MNNIQTYALLHQIVKELHKHREEDETCNQKTNQWVSRDVIMEYLGYGNTKIAEVEKHHHLITVKVGREKYFLKSSVEKLIASHEKTGWNSEKGLKKNSKTSRNLVK